MIDFHINYSNSGRWYDGQKMENLFDLEILYRENGFKGGLMIGLPGVATIDGLVREREKSDFFKFAPFIDCNDIKVSVERIVDEGFDFLKLHPRFSNFSIRNIPNNVFELLNEKEKTLIVCGWQQSQKLPISELSPLHIDVVAKAYPKINFVITHMGGQSLWEAFFCARSNRNVFLDTSYFVRFFEETSLFQDFKVVLDKLDQKVIFGSDYPERKIFEELKIIKALNLKDKKLENILFNNAKNLFEQYE